MTLTQTRVETWWFKCFPKNKPSEGDKLTITGGSSIGTLWVMRTNASKKFGLSHLDEERYDADLLELAGQEAFPIEQGGKSIRRFSPGTKIILVTEVTRSGFYIERYY